MCDIVFYSEMHFVSVLSALHFTFQFCGMDTFEKMNNDVAQWAAYQSQKMRRLVGSMTLKDKHAVQKTAWAKGKVEGYKQLEKSIGSGLKKDFGQVSRINFKFRRHGIFLEHGVGKGRPVRSAAANPKPWLKPILDPAIQTLANLVAENYLDIAAGEIKFNIPGIVSRSIVINNGK